MFWLMMYGNKHWRHIRKSCSKSLLYFWHVKGKLKHTEFLDFWSVHTFFPHQNWNFSKFCFVKPLEYKRFFCLLNKECILSFTWNICRVFSLQKYLSFACSFVVHAVNRARLRPIIMQSHFRPVENLCWAQHTNLNVWNITF